MRRSTAPTGWFLLSLASKVALATAAETSKGPTWGRMWQGRKCWKRLMSIAKDKMSTASCLLFSELTNFIFFLSHFLLTLSPSFSVSSSSFVFDILYDISLASPCRFSIKSLKLTHHTHTLTISLSLSTISFFSSTTFLIDIFAFTLFSLCSSFLENFYLNQDLEAISVFCLVFAYSHINPILF